MDIIKLLYVLELILREHIRDHFPVDWDEDTITRNILKELRTGLKSIKVNGLQSSMKIKWSLFKLTGKPETKFGDIALLVNITHQDGDRIEGVAFLEAKKRDIDSIKFGAMDIPQLSRISGNAPHSMVLLYDYDDITQFANVYSRLSIFGDWFKWKPCTHSVVVPTKIILETQKKDTTLYKFSVPFSSQLFFRYFHGFDLEFEREAINIAKGYSPSKGLPTYLIVACVAFGKAEPITEININRERFTTFE